MELDRKFKLLKPGQQVLDLAAAPGSWAQYAAQKIGRSGHVLALDLQEIEPIADNVTTLICDIAEIEQVERAMQKLNWDKVDIILSDVAPSTTGIPEVDHGRSIELNKHILNISQRYLANGGTLIMKVFEGSSFQQFVAAVKQVYKQVTVTKVEATRDRSFEKYLICR
jgi:23S rRNA (uridine2552-2'-O)-methyltransferase